MQPVEPPQQTLGNYEHIYWKDFELLQLFFLRLSGFPDLSDKKNSDIF